MAGRAPITSYNNLTEWGQARTFSAPWSDGDTRVLTIKKPYVAPNGLPCVPQVQSMLLTIKDFEDDSAANYAFRWLLNIGAGGNTTNIKLDALRTQQISVAGEQLSVSLLCEKKFPDSILPINPQTVGFNPPNVSPTAAVTIVDGNVGGSNASYTQAFEIPPNNAWEVEIPAMATSFRMTGADGQTSSPFVAGLRIFTNEPGGSSIFLGNLMNQYSGDFVPLTGDALSMTLENGTANTIRAHIQWGLDL